MYAEGLYFGTLLQCSKKITKTQLLLRAAGVIENADNTLSHFHKNIVCMQSNYKVKNFCKQN